MVLVGFPSVLLVPLIVPSPLEHDSSRWSRWKRWTIAFIVWNLIVPFTCDMAIAFYVSLTLRQIYSSVILLLILGTTPTLATPGVGLLPLRSLITSSGLRIRYSHRRAARRSSPSTHLFVYLVKVPSLHTGGYTGVQFGYNGLPEYH
ncbi:hypothetical protein J3A83DRAFT_1116060 [Scleroderma citrinum]